MWNDDGAKGPVKGSGKAIIGASISIKGEISGQEDLLIEGFVEGVVDLKQNVVTVSETGRVNASIHGRLVHVEGEVIGDLFGTEQVIVHKSGTVRGNVTAPRVSVEDGAKLKGQIDTETPTADVSVVRSTTYSPKKKFGDAFKAEKDSGDANGAFKADDKNFV